MFHLGNCEFWDGLLEHVFQRVLHGDTDESWLHEDGYGKYSRKELTPEFNKLLDHWVECGYNKHNSFFNQINVNEQVAETAKWRFPIRNIEARVFFQPPGQCLPTHVDTYEVYRKTYSIKNLKKITRYLVFLEDWKPGHCVFGNTGLIQTWNKWDTYLIRPGEQHGSANCGNEPKITMNVTGEYFN